MQVANTLKRQTGGGRNSNLELLRLVSMLMVLLLHSFWGYTHGSGIYQIFDFFRESASICAVNCFLIISGYFSIKWKLKSLFNLIFQLFYYAFIVYTIAALLGIVDFTINGFIHNASCLYTHWGFITNYLLLYLCAPLLNSFVVIIDEKKLLTYIIILIVSENLLTRDFSFLNYCTMYLIGRYLSKSDAINNMHIKAGYLYLITTILIFLLVYTSFRFMHITDAVIMNSIPWGLSYAAPLVIIQAVFLFIWFARLKFQSKCVNWCAASCLSIFLIHAHPAILQKGYYNYTESLYSLPILDHIYKLALLVIVVFFGSIFIDKIRIVISNLCYKVVLWFLKVTNLSETNILLYIPNQVSNG